MGAVSKPRHHERRGYAGTPGQQVSVVPEQVRDVGKYVYELTKALRSALDSAANDVDALTNGSWTGDSATEFANGWTDVRDGGVQINAAALQTSTLDLP